MARKYSKKTVSVRLRKSDENTLNQIAYEMGLETRGATIRWLIRRYQREIDANAEKESR